MIREELQEKWLAKRRISLEVADHFKLGFFEKCAIPMLGKDGGDDHTMPAENVWVLPLTNLANKLMAVKLHFETPPPMFKSKSLWVNYGTVPAHDRHANIKPRCAYNTFWPHIEHPRPKVAPLGEQTDINWWITQLPDELRACFQNRCEAEKLIVAAERAETVEALQALDLERAMRTAFDGMRAEIFSAVEKSLTHNRGNQSASNYVVLVGGAYHRMGIRTRPSGLCRTAIGRISSKPQEHSTRRRSNKDGFPPT
jgi:hypothetical protein